MMMPAGRLLACFDGTYLQHVLSQAPLLGTNGDLENMETKLIGGAWSLEDPGNAMVSLSNAERHRNGIKKATDMFLGSRRLYNYMWLFFCFHMHWSDCSAM